MSMESEHVESRTRALSSTSSSSSRSSLEIDVGCSRVRLRSQEPVSPSDNATLTPSWSMLSSSPPIGTDDHVFQMTSPTIQTMEHPPGYDPNRIPLSVFATKADASDWSNASNESLFSIHMGNNSFSHSILWRCGELSAFDEWNSHQSFKVSNSKYHEFSSLPSFLPPVIEASAHEECSVKSSSASRADNVGSSNNFTVINSAGPTNMELGSSNNPRLSTESGRSSISFAFPVLVNDGVKNGSMKEVEEKPKEAESQTQDCKGAEASPVGRWFPCFPRCC